MTEIERRVAKDEALIQSLLKLEPVFLLECAQDLAASARYLQKLRDSKAELRGPDAEFVSGYISRAFTRSAQHLDDSGFNRAYDEYHSQLTELLAESPESIIEDHDCGLLKGLMTDTDKKDVSQALRERRWAWFWNGMTRLRSPGKSFSRIAEFARNTRDHWLLRPVAIGGAVIALDVAEMAGEVIGLNAEEFNVSSVSHRLLNRPDAITRMVARFSSIPLGICTIAQPFVCKPRGDR